MSVVIPPGRVTELLDRFHAGDHLAYNQLMELVYEKVRGIARYRFRDVRPGHTLQPTALAHEAFIRLTNAQQLGPHRGAFFAIVATAIRHAFVDYTRRRVARKRRERVKFEVTVAPDEPIVWDLLALDEALGKLERVDKRRYDIVQLRFFLGLTPGEIAANVGMSERTVFSDLTAARLWLHHEMTRA